MTDIRVTRGAAEVLGGQDNAATTARVTASSAEVLTEQSSAGVDARITSCAVEVLMTQAEPPPVGGGVRRTIINVNYF